MLSVNHRFVTEEPIGCLVSSNRKLTLLRPQLSRPQLSTPVIFVMRQKSNILKFNFGPPTLVLQSVQIKVSIFVVDAQKSNLVVLENMLSGIF